MRFSKIIARLSLALVFFACTPVVAQAGPGSLPAGSRHGNFLTRHGTTYSPPRTTAGETLTGHSSARGSQFGWFGLFGVLGLAGLWNATKR